MMGKGIDNNRFTRNVYGVYFGCWFLFFVLFFLVFYNATAYNHTHQKKEKKIEYRKKERKQVVNSWWSMKRVDMLQLLEIQSRS